MPIHLVTDWWKLEYAGEIMVHLKEREISGLVTRKLQHQSPQLSFRALLINHIRDTAVALKFSTITVHMAIYYMDHFMDKHEIKKDQLKFIATGCLQLAAKSEELDYKIPKFSKYLSYLDRPYTMKDFCILEETLLKFFNFDLLYPSSVHFAEYFLLFSVSEGDLHEDRAIGKESGWESRMREIVMVFLTQALLEVGIAFVHLPSIIAATCIYLVRNSQELLPYWPERLVHATGYTEDNLRPCLKDMLLTYKSAGFIEVLETIFGANLKTMPDVKEPTTDYGYKNRRSSPTIRLLDDGFKSVIKS